MGKNTSFNITLLSHEPKKATQIITESLFKTIYPVMLKVRNKLDSYAGFLLDEDISKLKEVFGLCISQIRKCLQTLFDIFKTEHHGCVVLQESRQCTIERLTWCINRLLAIEHKVDISSNTTDKQEDFANDSMLTAPMYFVNWIDHTFEILSKLANLIYKTDYKDNDALYVQWKNDVIDCISTLHISLDELLLSAMTLCKYCLPSDQNSVKVRCQVVLREFKALISELIEGDLDSGVTVKPELLKLPLKPSTVNVLIDVLKDVLYVLETNTNTALLALVVHCFSHSVSPVDMLMEHFKDTKGTCSCHMKSEGEVTEDCSFVKEFDLYNERLLQIGSFAVSCSSDQSRILILRSGLASLEALDPHLVPALMLSPLCAHARLLTDTWRREVLDIKDSIFLIVDPAAFAEKTKQMVLQMLQDLTKESSYNNNKTCSVINTACVVLDFFSVYTQLEPDALTPFEKLVPLLADLDKVQKECKVVSNLLSSGEDFVYDIKTLSDKTPSLNQLNKRLKLLYTLVSRINSLLHPRENEELFDCVDEEAPNKNMTQTYLGKNNVTYNVAPPMKPANISRSIFARTTNIRSSSTKFPLGMLTKHLKSKMRDNLSFSVQLDELFNLSEAKPSGTGVYANKQLDSVREPSILYNYSPAKRSSLRKAVLTRHRALPLDIKEAKKGNEKVAGNSSNFNRESLMDDVTSLQITDILNQMSDITSTFAKKPVKLNEETTKLKKGEVKKEDTDSNIVRISINSNESLSKHIWNIPVNASTVEMPLDNSSDTMASNMTLSSNVTTLERLNDIDLVESRLKSLELETNL